MNRFHIPKKKGEPPVPGKRRASKKNEEGKRTIDEIIERTKGKCRGIWGGGKSISRKALEGGMRGGRREGKSG